MNMDLARTLEAMVMAGLPADRTPTEAELRGLIDGIGNVCKAEQDVKDHVLKQIMERQRIRMDTGIQLVAEHKPWLAARMASIEPFFWDRYFKYLERTR